jgi:hypothetical protein
MAADQASAGEGETAQVMRKNLFESLPPSDQELFLTTLEKALESGLGKDEAWDQAWESIQERPVVEADEEEDFALEDEALPESNDDALSKASKKVRR